MKNTVVTISFFVMSFLSISSFAQKDKLANDKIIADSLKLSSELSSQRAELAGLATTLKEESDKLDLYKKEQEDLKSKSMESAQKVQTLSEKADTEKEAKKLEKQSKDAQKDANKFKKAISNVEKQQSKVEGIQKKQAKLQASIEKNEKKIGKLREKLK